MNTYTSRDRTEIQKEVDRLMEELDRISNTTEFNTKRLLDGSASALVSSDKLTTRVIMRDGLRTIDQFGQKMTGGGNYKLSIVSTPGQNQVLKTNRFMVNQGDDAGKGASDTTLLHDLAQFWDADGNFILEDPQSITVAQADGKTTSFTLYSTDTVGDLRDKLNTALAEGLGQGDGLAADIKDKFVSYVQPDDVPYSAMNDIQKIIYGLKRGWMEMSEKRVEQYYGITGSGANLDVHIYDGGTTGALAAVNWAPGTELWIDVQDFKPATWPNGDNMWGPAFYGDRVIAHEMTHAIMGAAMNIAALPTWFVEGAAELMQGADARVLSDYTALGGNPAAVNTIMGTVNAGWVSDSPHYSGGYVAVRYLETLIAANNPANTLKDFMLYLAAGNTMNAAIANYTALASTAAFQADAAGANGRTFLTNLIGSGSLANVDTGAIGGADDSGGPVISPADVIDESLATDTVDGQPLAHWNVIWPTDTVNPDTDSLGLGDSGGMYLDVPGLTRNVSDTGFESVGGTLVIRSGVAGSLGEMTFIADDQVLKALGLNTLQKATDSVYSVTVSDAHTGAEVASDVKSSTNWLVGAINPNVDVQFDANSGITMTWNATNLNFQMSGGATETFVHLADRTLALQIGANEGQDLGIAIGNMGIRALGLEGIMVTNRELAGRAITRIDSAINRVSSQRSKVGAVQNRLEHTINNLNVANENLTAGESRIRDVDMAAEMMEYTKWGVLAQAGTAMLAQANQRPQMVLQLLSA